MSGDLRHPVRVRTARDVKDYAGALEHFTASLAGQTKLFGAHSIRTAQGEYNLRLAERAVGHHAEALLRFGSP